jgi:hypothetical protein
MTVNQKTVNDDPATADTTTICTLGSLFFTGPAEVTRVLCEQTGAADAQWNVELGGNDLFANEQSVDAADTVESFVPDQNEYSSTESDQLAVSVSTAGSAGNLIVTVVYETPE